jgi:hypothetical protein
MSGDAVERAKSEGAAALMSAFSPDEIVRFPDRFSTAIAPAPRLWVLNPSAPLTSPTLRRKGRPSSASWPPTRGVRAVETDGEPSSESRPPLPEPQDDQPHHAQARGHQARSSGRCGPVARGGGSSGLGPAGSRTVPLGLCLPAPRAAAAVVAVGRAGACLRLGLSSGRPSARRARSSRWWSLCAWTHSSDRQPWS